MKAIMIAIKAKWCAKIMNGDKTIEVRKNKALANAIQKLIEENGYADIYVYCSKGKERLVNLIDDSFYCGASTRLNGKVIFKFRCYKVEEIKYHFGYYDMGKWTESYILENSCLSAEELNTYLQASKEYDETKVSRVYGYAIHISDLEIFDKPKELSDFRKYYRSKEFPQNRSWNLTKAPQNMVYIEEN